MELGRTYYVVRTQSGAYPPVLGDGGHARLVVFTDHDEALRRAKREAEHRGEDTIVGHMEGHEVHKLARNREVEYILVVDKEGNRKVELAEGE